MAGAERAHDEPPKRGWMSSDLLRAALLLVGVWVVMHGIWMLRPLVIIALLGILLGIALTPIVDWMHERLRFKRGIAAATVMLTIIGLFVLGGFLLAPAIREQAAELREQLPNAIERVDEWIPIPMAGFGGADADANGEQPEAGVAEQPAPDPANGEQQRRFELPDVGDGGVVSRIAQFVLPALSRTVEAVAGLFLILFIGMYFAADPGIYRRGVLHLVPHQHRDRARDVLRELGIALRAWMVARLLSMLAVGILTAGLLYLIGIRLALVLGLIAGIFEFVPFFGPLVAAIPAIGIGLLDSPQTALWVLIAFVAIQQLESAVISPLLLKNRVHIPPMLTIIFVPAMTIFFGMAGVLIAEPLLVIALVLTQMLYVKDVVGDDVREEEK
jgi:predicted PurR-regulated permease PerM